MVRTTKASLSVRNRYGDQKRTSAFFIDDDTYRMHSGGATTWGGPYFGYRDTFGHRLLAAVRAVVRLIVPVVALLIIFLKLMDFLDVTVPAYPGPDGIYWLNGGYLILPLAFFVVQLTNRRYGPAYAFAQVVLSLAVVLGFILFAKDDTVLFVRPEVVPGVRVAVAFGAAFLVASFISIIAFDGTRGPCWWSAPLSGFLCAAVFFPPVFFPAAFAGLGVQWIGEALTYMGIMAGIGVALLIPYFMMRRLVPPLSGFGGY